jgi:uncharacterized coiled-coil DUF342 family protein
VELSWQLQNNRNQVDQLLELLNQMGEQHDEITSRHRDEKRQFEIQSDKRPNQERIQVPYIPRSENEDKTVIDALEQTAEIRNNINQHNIIRPKTLQEIRQYRKQFHEFSNKIAEGSEIAPEVIVEMLADQLLEELMLGMVGELKQVTDEIYNDITESEFKLE